MSTAPPRTPSDDVAPDAGDDEPPRRIDGTSTVDGTPPAGPTDGLPRFLHGTPSDPRRWRSPLRGPWLTAVLGSLLLVGVPIVIVTGLASHAAYDPQLGRNAVVPRDLGIQPFLFSWPTRPTWLYAASQGTHVVLGIVLVPVIVAKLWSVIPKLFAFPPARSPADALERLSALAIVVGMIFQLATGIANVQLWYPWKFNFVVAHYYGAWVTIGAFVLHVFLKLPTVRRAYRTRGALKPLLDGVGDTKAEPWEPGGLASPNPGPATISRRGALGLVGAASGGLFLMTAGQVIGGPLRDIALFAPRGAGAIGPGQQGFPVNKTARLARVTQRMTGSTWRLSLEGRRSGTLRRDQLLGMELHTYDLPIACVEGWNSTQTWTGVRLRDLRDLARADHDWVLHVESLQPAGAFRQTTLSAGQVDDEQSLLALRVNGEDLSMDHGYPARIIVPALPGVHCTKWVGGLRFSAT